MWVNDDQEQLLNSQEKVEEKGQKGPHFWTGQFWRTMNRNRLVKKSLVWNREVPNSYRSILCDMILRYIVLWLNVYESKVFIVPP
jgi:hypothetical protein